MIQVKHCRAKIKYENVIKYISHYIVTRRNTIMCFFTNRTNTCTIFLTKISVFTMFRGRRHQQLYTHIDPKCSDWSNCSPHYNWSYLWVYLQRNTSWVREDCSIQMISVVCACVFCVSLDLITLSI